MEWEYLGIQQLPAIDARGKGHTYALSMWRTPVPGGWLLITLNSRSNLPQPVQSFYPDADHVWTGKTPAESAYLLRPASGGNYDSASEQLLRATDEGEPKRLSE